MTPHLWILANAHHCHAHWPEEAKLSGCHPSRIHSSIQQIFPGYRIPAEFHYVDVDSGIPYPFILTNFLPNLLFLLSNSWPHASDPVDLTHYLDTAGLTFTVVFCFSWKSHVPGIGPTESRSWINTQMCSKQVCILPSLDCCSHMQNSLLSRSTFR